MPDLIGVDPKLQRRLAGLDGDVRGGLLQVVLTDLDRVVRLDGRLGRQILDLGDVALADEEDLAFGPDQRRGTARLGQGDAPVEQFEGDDGFRLFGRLGVADHRIVDEGGLGCRGGSIAAPFGNRRDDDALARGESWRSSPASPRERAPNRTPAEAAAIPNPSIDFRRFMMHPPSRESEQRVTFRTAI
ncbi:MAG: hypothetical protein WKF75_14845 [Singulisphaera sp.]